MFVKHLENITSICFVATLECSSLVSCCILDGIMLLIAESCHSCFARHLQTMHPFPVIFISILTEIISYFQWHTWFSKLMPWSSYPFWSTHMHCTSYLVLLVLCKPCTRIRWSLYRFQPKSPPISIGTLVFPSWGQVQSFLVKSCICIPHCIPHSISSSQRHTWFAKLMPCSSFFFRSTHMHRISHLAYHGCFASCCLCIFRDWLWFHCLCSCCG